MGTLSRPTANIPFIPDPYSLPHPRALSRYEKIDFQKEVRKRYLQLKAQDDANAAMGEDGTAVPWVRVDAARSIDEVRTEVLAVATRVLQDCGSQPIKALWKA